MYPGDHFCWGGWWMFPMIMPIIFLIILIIILYLIFGRRGFGPPWWGKHPGEESATALEILKKRYAKGELSKEEFERMKKDLLE